MKPGLGNLGGDGRKRLAVRAGSVNSQRHLPGVIIGPGGQVFSGHHLNRREVQQSGQGRFHGFGVLLELDRPQLPALGLGDIVDAGEVVAPARGGPGEDAGAVLQLRVQHKAAQVLPVAAGMDHGGLRELGHGQGDVPGTIGGVVPLKLQVTGKFLRVLGDLYDAGIPEGSGGFLVRLPFLPPFGVRCGFVADDLA